MRSRRVNSLLKKMWEPIVTDIVNNRNPLSACFKVTPKSPEYADKAIVVEQLLNAQVGSGEFQRAMDLEMKKWAEDWTKKFEQDLWEDGMARVRQEGSSIPRIPWNEDGSLGDSRPIGREYYGVTGGDTPVYNKLASTVLAELTPGQVREIARLSPELGETLRAQCPDVFKELVVLKHFPADASFGEDYTAPDGRLLHTNLIYSEYEGPYKGQGLHLDSLYRWRLVDGPNGIGQTLVGIKDL